MFLFRCVLFKAACMVTKTNQSSHAVGQNVFFKRKSEFRKVDVASQGSLAVGESSRNFSPWMSLSRLPKAGWGSPRPPGPCQGGSQQGTVPSHSAAVKPRGAQWVRAALWWKCWFSPGLRKAGCRGGTGAQGPPLSRSSKTPSRVRRRTKA